MFFCTIYRGTFLIQFTKRKAFSGRLRSINCTQVFWFPGDSDGKESACSAGDMGSIPGLGRSPGGGYVNPCQYSCLGESPWTRGAWWAIFHKVAKGLIWLSDEALLILNPVCFLLSLYKISRFLFIMFWNNRLTPLLKTWQWILHAIEFDMIDQGGMTWKPLS